MNIFNVESKFYSFSLSPYEEFENIKKNNLKKQSVKKKSLSKRRNGG